MSIPVGGDLATVGRTEEILGRWLAGKRQSFVVATKCFGRMGPLPWNQGMSRKHILDAIDASLRRLRTDYVDIYQLHGHDAATPLDEALEALDRIVQSGKARYIGVSNWLGLPDRARHRPDGGEEPGPDRLRPAPLQSALPGLRARPAAALPGGGRRRHPL